MIEDESEIDETGSMAPGRSGITSGASAPEKLLAGSATGFEARGVTEIVPFVSPPEHVFFKPPPGLRRAQARSRA